MDKKKICRDLAAKLEKELYTQERWEDRLATVWVQLNNNPILELAERLVEHAVRTNVPKIDISHLPKTVSGWREVNTVIRQWAKDIQHKHEGTAVDNALSNVVGMVTSFIDQTINEEAQNASNHLHNVTLMRLLNQYILDTKAYEIQPELTQLIRTGWYPGIVQQPRSFGFGYSGNEVDSRVYINQRMHIAIDALSKMEDDAFETKPGRPNFY